MNAIATSKETSTSNDRVQFATFYVGELLMGVDIRLVQEINRQLEMTPVPNAPRHVRGVINLRGEVATVIDLRTVLGLPPAEQTRDTRNLIVHSQGEAIGLLVDRISDILTVRPDQISEPPSNVDGVDGKFFLGVHTLEKDICVLLDVEEVLSDRD
ncbi:chemotaxis protein CheW [Botrimarina mediterranea]|uniref:Chemotaxis protein CheW n=1 Tax=Botrimarina mediterranea TaxID=2528022 RepID=A0A518KCF3_9BACT|nr:chemotaxis protein CheW [Botrimarina mediterranea]QDV75439.1 Chemotaxis protein CheW [Botrimarina mediterranea]QDV80072.1 Chemotaxis protein CheW [Planctomycetes bacterium K2D]